MPSPPPPPVSAASIPLPSGKSQSQGDGCLGPCWTQICSPWENRCKVGYSPPGSKLFPAQYFDMPNYVYNSFNLPFALGFLIRSVFGSLPSGIEFYELGVPVILIPMNHFSSS